MKLVLVLLFGILGSALGQAERSDDLSEFCKYLFTPLRMMEIIIHPILSSNLWDMFEINIPTVVIFSI